MPSRRPRARTSSWPIRKPRRTRISGSAGLSGAPAGVTNFGGKVETTLAQFGLTARPMPKLSLVGNVRWEDRRDKTPIQFYNIENTALWTNYHDSREKLDAKLEGSYLLPGNTRATLASTITRSTARLPSPTTVDIAGLSALRGKNTEWVIAPKLRRAVSDTVTGHQLWTEPARRDGLVQPGGPRPTASS